jgi:hypothetical protein
MPAVSVVKFEGAYGEVTEGGFEISFPNVEPTEKKLVTCDNLSGVTRSVTDWKGTRRFTDDNVVYRSRKSVLSESRYGGGVSGLFFGSMLTAYNPHHAVCLRPEVLWQLIANQVGIYVLQNADACAHFFTKNPDTKEHLEVEMDPTESWGQMILKFRAMFDERIAADVLQAFLPKFSTTDHEAEVTTLLTFMETVSPWYSYGALYCCGFPKILIAGKLSDWKKMVTAVTTLSTMFDGLRYYFSDLIGVLQEIVQTLESRNVEAEFWGSMFRYHSNSSAPVLDGWLSAFVAFRRVQADEKSRKAENELRAPQEFNWRDQWRRANTIDFEDLPQGLNFVDFKLRILPTNSESNFVLMGGVIGSEMEPYLTPRLGFAVVAVD